MFLVLVVFLALLRDALCASEVRLAIGQALHVTLAVASLAFVGLGRFAVLIDANIRHLFLFDRSARVRVVVALRHRDGGEADLVVDLDHFRLAVGLFSGVVIIIVILVAAAATAAAARLMVAISVLAHFAQLLGGLAFSVLDQVVHVELTHVSFLGEVGVAEFVGGLQVEVTAKTALLSLVVLRQFHIDRVSIEINFDTGIGQIDIDGGSLLIDLGDQMTVIIDILIILRIVGFSIHVHLDRIVLLAFGCQVNAVLASDDLDLLLISAAFRFTSHNHEFGLLRGAILGQHDPAIGERCTERGSVECLHLRTTLPAGLAGDRALRLIIVLILLVHVSAHLIGERSFLIQGHRERLTQWQILDQDVLFRGSDGDVESLFRLRVQDQFGADLVLSILHVHLVDVRLPEVVVFQGSVQFVGGVLDLRRYVLVIDIHAVFQQLTDSLNEILLRQRRAPALVILALLLGVVLFVIAEFAFPLHLLTTAFGLSGDLDEVLRVARLTPTQLSLTEDLLLLDLVDELRSFREHHLGVQARLPLFRLLTVQFGVDASVSFLGVVDVGQFQVHFVVGARLQFDVDLGLVSVLHLVFAVFLEGLLHLLLTLLLIALHVLLLTLALVLAAFLRRLLLLSLSLLILLLILLR